MSNEIVLSAVREYGGFSHQKDALLWLQREAGKVDGLLWSFARTYRNNTDGSTINFVDVAEYFAELSHQISALEALEDSLPLETVEMFDVQYNTEPTLPDRVQLNLPWFPQTDSQVAGQADRMCFSSSVTMCAHYQSPVFRSRFTGSNADDQYLRFLHASFGDTTNPDAHIRALRSLGLNPTFRTDLSLATAIELLQRGIPLAIGFLHRGSVHDPQGGGHYAALLGFQQNRNMFYLHDPFGSLHDGYTGPVENGRNVQYSRAELNNRWTVEHFGVDGKSGWGLYITP